MIRNIFLAIFLVIICSLGGCDKRENTPSDTKPVPTIATNAEVPTQTLTPDEQKVQDLKKQLEAAEKKADDAKKDIVAKLTAEKEILVLQKKLAETYSKIWEENAKNYSLQITSKDKEIKDAKLDAWKEKLWWMAGICGLLAIVAGGIAWGFPLVRSFAIKAGLVLGAISVTMLIVAQCLATVAWLLGFVPYILGFAIVVALVFGGLALRHWWKDHNGLKQTVEGIEPIKEKLEGFKDHMLKYVDGTMVDHVKAYRNKLGIIKDKVTKK